MFEPLKLISVGIMLLLLAPFGFVFWLLATHPPRPESERRAQLEASIREESRRLGETNADGSFVGGVGVTITETVAVSQGTARWLSFYPRQWVGWLGLVAVATVAVCVVLALFFPGSNAMSVSAWDKPGPAAAKSETK